MTWELELDVEVDDLRGGQKTLRIACRVDAPTDRSRPEVEAEVAAALGGSCWFLASRYGLLPENFAVQQETLTDRINARLPFRCEVRSVALAP